MCIRCNKCGEEIRPIRDFLASVAKAIKRIRDRILRIEECRHKNLYIPHYLRIQRHAKCRLFCIECMKVIDWEK